MKTRILIALALAALVAATHSQTLDKAFGEKILASIDGLRTFEEGDLSATMTMITEDPDEGTDKHVIKQFRRDSEDKFLMLIQEPAVELGQGYLKVDQSLWFYDPESRQFTHVSMKEQFSGSDARNSDFGASTLNEDYEVVSVTEGKLGRFNTYILELKALNDEVTYYRTKIWVSKDPTLPLKTEDYSETGRLMRTSLFPNYAHVGGSYVATTMIFKDELVQNKKTQITLDNVSSKKLPDSVFTKAYVERVNR